MYVCVSVLEKSVVCYLYFLFCLLEISVSALFTFFKHKFSGVFCIEI